MDQFSELERQLLALDRKQGSAWLRGYFYALRSVMHEDEQAATERRNTWLSKLDEAKKVLERFSP